MRIAKTKRTIKGKVIPKILEMLQAQAETTMDLLDIFASNYVDSYQKIRRGLVDGPRQFNKDWTNWYIERQKFYSLLNQLKNQGFVEKSKNPNEKTIWNITKKGLEKLMIEKNNQSGQSRENYKKEADNRFKVIIFDVPEREKEKRSWLRGVLYALGFSLLQKSVWIGKNKIPEKFIKELKRRGMISYIHIFMVNKKGSIGYSLE